MAEAPPPPRRARACTQWLIRRHLHETSVYGDLVHGASMQHQRTSRRLDTAFPTALRSCVGRTPIAVACLSNGPAFSRIKTCSICRVVSRAAIASRSASLGTPSTTAMVPGGAGPLSPAACATWAVRNPLGRSSRTITKWVWGPLLDEELGAAATWEDEERAPKRSRSMGRHGSLIRRACSLVKACSEAVSLASVRVTRTAAAHIAPVAEFTLRKAALCLADWRMRAFKGSAYGGVIGKRQEFVKITASPHRGTHPGSSAEPPALGGGFSFMLAFPMAACRSGAEQAALGTQLDERRALPQGLRLHLVKPSIFLRQT